MSDFKNIQVWQKSVDLVQTIYVLTQNFPDEEKFGLVSQIRRCAVSIPSNIAEGHGRFSNRDNSHFLKIAYGSCLELHTQLIISNRFSLIDEIKYRDVIQQLSEVEKMLFAMIKRLMSNI